MSGTGLRIKHFKNTNLPLVTGAPTICSHHLLPPSAPFNIITLISLGEDLKFAKLQVVPLSCATAYVCLRPNNIHNSRKSSDSIVTSIWNSLSWNLDLIFEMDESLFSLPNRPYGVCSPPCLLWTSRIQENVLPWVNLTTMFIWA
jgi:hypothetical protein